MVNRRDRLSDGSIRYCRLVIQTNFQSGGLKPWFKTVFQQTSSKNSISKNSISKTRCAHAIIILGGENNTVHSAAMSSITYNFNQLTQDVSTYGY